MTGQGRAGQGEDRQGRAWESRAVASPCFSSPVQPGMSGGNRLHRRGTACRLTNTDSAASTCSLGISSESRVWKTAKALIADALPEPSTNIMIGIPPAMPHVAVSALGDGTKVGETVPAGCGGGQFFLTMIMAGT